MRVGARTPAVEARPPAGQAPTAPVTPLLKVRGLSRRFGEVVALDEVSLDIRPNEFFALLGPSGCGKTTLLRILAGFESPDRGEVSLDGRDLLDVPPHRRPVNLMFQNYALFPHMTVRQNVSFGLERERLPRREVRQRVDEVLDTVGLVDEHRRRPAQLSGGQRQRVALARAIVKRPRLLLLDEPLSALDRKVRAEMQLELKRLQHEVGITFVVVTHDQTEALSLADRVAVLSQGRVRQVADPVTLYERPADVFVASFVGDTNLLAGHREARGFAADGLGPVPAPAAGVASGTEADGDAAGTAAGSVGAAAGSVAVGDATAAGSVGAAAGSVGDASTGTDSSASPDRPVDSLWLSLRPERLVLGPPGAGVLDGTVLEVQYVGGSSTVAVDVPGCEEPLLTRAAGPPGVRRDEAVSLAWRAADAVVVGREPSDGSQARPSLRPEPPDVSDDRPSRSPGRGLEPDLEIDLRAVPPRRVEPDRSDPLVRRDRPPHRPTAPAAQ